MSNLHSSLIAMESNYENERLRSRFPSSSSEERTPSSESLENSLVKSQELIEKTDDPLKGLLVDDEIDGFKEIDQKDYESARGSFRYFYLDNKSPLACLMSGELYENGPPGTWKIFRDAYKHYKQSLLKAEDSFLVSAAQRAFDRIAVKYSLDVFQLPVIMKQPTHIPVKKPVEHTRSTLHELADYINQSYSYLEIFNKIEDSLSKDLVFSEFFRAINFPYYNENKSYTSLWKALENHFPDEFAIYSNNAGKPIINPLSVDIRNIKAKKEVNNIDPLAKFFKVHPFIVNGFNALDYKQYERAYIQFFHYLFGFVSAEGPYKLNPLSDLVFDEILEVGIGFTPSSPDKALFRYEKVGEEVQDCRLKKLFNISAERIKNKQEAEKANRYANPQKESKKSKKLSPKKTAPQTSMDGSDYSAPLMSDFIHHLLKTHPFIKINDALNMEQDFPFTDLLRLTMHPDYYENNPKPVLQAAWVTLKISYTSEFMEYVEENNIQIKPPSPVQVIKKAEPQNNTKSSWWPSFNWPFGGKNEPSVSDTVPLLEDKKHV